MVTARIIIKDSAAKVWQALTNKDQMKEWYFDIPDFELRVGAIFNFFEPGGENQFHHRCQIKEIVTNRRFSHTWTHPNHSKGESVVTWLLNEIDGATEVTLQHEGVESFTDAGPTFNPENYQAGWDGFMYVLKNYVYGIRKHSYSIEINAPADRVWNVLLNDDTFRRWTAVFCEGSYYKGELKLGKRVHFLTPEGSGVYVNVVICTPPSNILFQHIGNIMNFIEQPIDEVTEKWTGTFENYILKSNGSITTLIAEIDLTPEHINFFNDKFPKGLEIVKQISELSN